MCIRDSDEVVSEARVAGIVRDGRSVGQAIAGEDIELVLDRTCLLYTSRCV